MTEHKKYENESQDARRRDKHNATHPDEKVGNPLTKPDRNEENDSHSHPTKRK